MTEHARAKGYVVVPLSDTECEIVPVDDPVLISAFASFLVDGYEVHENYWRAYGQARKWIEARRKSSPR
jgi:hypothetical protein